MEIVIVAEGEVVESQELLNGTRTVAFEAQSSDAVWLLSGVISWNLGLLDFPGEGDLTLARDDGTELYASLASAVARDINGTTQLDCEYDVDGGAGQFDGATGSAAARVQLEGSSLQISLAVTLGQH